MKHTINGFITSTQYTVNGEKTIDFRTYKPTAEYSPNTVVVREHSFEVDVPEDFDPRPAMIASLEEQKQIARKKFADEMRHIDNRIQSLLAIENSPTVEA